MLCAKFQNDLTTEYHIISQRDFVRIRFKMNFWPISYIAQPPPPGLLSLGNLSILYFALPYDNKNTHTAVILIEKIHTHVVNEPTKA